jgi:hypothetical protein
MGIRAAGELKGKKKPQGAKDDGYATIQTCLEKLTEPTNELAAPKSKPYGLAVGLVVYSCLGVSLGITGLIASKATHMILGK